MINKLVLRRFKAFKEAVIPLKSLTILAGINGTGKSSCIQSLLLLRQSFLEGTLPSNGLLLRGALLSLGTGQDVYHQFSTEETIDIELEANGESRVWSFDVAMESDLLPVRGAPPPVGDSVFNGPPFSAQFWYVSAERISPDTSYPTAYHPAADSGTLGRHGEFAIDYLAKNQNAAITNKSVKHFSLPDDATDLLANTRSWLSEISPNVSLSLERFPQLDRSAVAFDYLSGNQTFSHKLRPINVGFGLTYCLPVIVALLAASPGDMVIIENPESHIHPQGQLELGMLASLAAAGGVQVIVETHSDHFLNGVRLAVKRKRIPPQNASILYFSRNCDDTEHSSQIVVPQIDESGKIDVWPQGFFDQWQEALFELL